MLGTDKMHKLDSLFILLIFTVFAVVSLLLVAIGAGVYQRVVGHMQENNGIRSSLSYVSNKVRSADQAGGIDLRQIDGMSVLCIKDPASTAAVTDYIYFYDGNICEAVTFDEMGFDVKYGSSIAGVKSFQMSLTGGRLLDLSVSDQSGKTLETSVCLRSADLGPIL